MVPIQTNITWWNDVFNVISAYILFESEKNSRLASAYCRHGDRNACLSMKTHWVHRSRCRDIVGCRALRSTWVGNGWGKRIIGAVPGGGGGNRPAAAATFFFVSLSPPTLYRPMLVPTDPYTTDAVSMRHGRLPRIDVLAAQNGRRRHPFEEVHTAGYALVYLPNRLSGTTTRPIE